jgi:putative chitinase
MNINELDSYNLADAVKFHRRLNPRIWGRDEHLLPEVRDRLLAIAEDFQEFLGVEDLNVEDITISGSNAAYSYTKNSDIDLHLVVKMPDNPVYQELFNAKKYQYNDEHNIRIGGADVELYVQPADQAHHSQGIYSVRNNEWISIPQRKRAQVDDACVRDKTADLDARIHAAVKSKNIDAMSTLWDKIKTMRRVGLEQHGEFGCENIAFKMLRNSGCIKLLKDAMMAAQDRELSLREAPRQRFRYGFSEGHQGQPYSSEDGVAASTKEFLEDAGSNDQNLVHEFIQHTAMELGIDPMPEIVLHTNPEWSTNNHSFGRYDPESHTLNVSLPNRHVLDVLRTVAHELVHCSQNQQHGELPADAGETGSRWENDANARAGIIMRDWANTHPEHFELPPLEEGASGYIPKNKREAKLPQYAMALSVDIKPGQTGKEANKLALHTGRNGEPGLLMKTANLREYAMPQPSHGPGKYRDLNEPLGPETPPEMPDGTIKVDVSDMYDWYKLGQKISDLDSIKSGELGQGPPSTVFAFGSEDLENMYSHELTRLGLKTHDLDEPGEEDIDEGWKSALAGAAAAGAMAFTPAPTNNTVPATGSAVQPAAVQQTPGAAAESALSRIAQAAGIKGVELAQFLAQCAHETGDFAHLEELGGSRYLAKYDPSVNPAKAKALGNTEAGDGARYKGRGFIQITGKANYANAGQALGIDLVNNPELAARPDVAAKIAVWYWQNRVVPYVQDFSDTRGVTKRINPGLQGLQDRQSNFNDYQQQVSSTAQPRVAQSGTAV